MIPFAFLETDSRDLKHVWDEGIALFDRQSEGSLDMIAEHTPALIEYVSTYLLLTGDTIQVKEMIHHLMEHDIDHHLPSVLALPAIIEEYWAYTKDLSSVCFWVDRLSSLYDAINSQCVRDAYTYALYIGGRVVLQRLYAACNMPLNRVSLSQMISEFHRKHYDAEQRLYIDDTGDVSLIITTVVAAGGYVCDDAQDVVRAYLIEHGFEVPRDASGFLFRALMNLEVEDTLFPCVLECGCAKETDHAGLLSGIHTLIQGLIGVDISMLGNGIQCMTPRLPTYISYRLVLPIGAGCLTFEGGDNCFEICDSSDY